MVAMQKLAGKVAVVTGASKGIGAAIAKRLADEGASVVVNYASSKEAADRVVAAIAAKGGKAVAVQANMADKADIQRLFAETQRAFGRLDVLVNNAGVYEFAPLEEVTAEHFHRMFDLNVLGLLFASQEAVKHFGSDGGSIINISSVAATAAPPTTSVYSGTKAAVNAVTRSLAQELGPQDPRQRDQPRHGRDGRDDVGRHHRRCERISQTDGCAHPPGPHRSAPGHCPRRGLSGLGRLGVADGRDLVHFRRPSLTGAATLTAR